MVLCECGCEQSVKPGRRFVHGHNPGPPKRDAPEWITADCGYETNCWVWLKARNDRGYGKSWDPTKGYNRSAHRMVWERLRGPVPDGLELDHLCRNRACVNPDHLEVVTHKENMRRGYAVVRGQLAEGVAGRIKQARLAAGMSQSDLAERIACSSSLVALWETGKINPTVERFEDVLAVTMIRKEGG